MWCYEGVHEFQRVHCWSESDSRKLIEDSKQVNKKIRTETIQFIQKLVDRNREICENWRSEFDIEFKVRFFLGEFSFNLNLEKLHSYRLR